MTDTPRTLGAAGEAAACAYLERQGYRILARNVRAGGVELDIVAERRGVLAFVEVKTRRSTDYGSAAEAVDARKRARIAQGAAAWLRANRGFPRQVRFDVITCELEARGGFRVTHWEAAFDVGE